MERVVIIGAGAICDNIVEQFQLHEHLEYIHDEPRILGERKFSVPIEKRKLNPYLNYISAIGDTRNKRKAVDELYGAWFRNFIDGSSWIAKSAIIGLGIYIQPYAVIWNDCVICDHVTLLNTCSIGHNTTIGRYSIVCPEAVIGGNCEVGQGVWVGANSTIREKIRVGDGAFIGQGANVVKDVEPNTVVMGNPAKAYKTLEKW